MKVFSILEELEAAGNGRNKKMEILKKYKTDKDIQKVLVMAYDTTRTYGVTTDEVTATPLESYSSNQAWSEFQKLLDKLAARKLTGDAAKDAVAFALKERPLDERKWYTRIINRDLQIGMTSNTANKVWKGLIFNFKTMAANEAKMDKLKFPYLVDPKMDGMRMVFFIYDDHEMIMSRGGKEYPQLSFIAEELRRGYGTGVYDGEMLAANWNETIHLVKKSVEKMSDEDKVKREKELFFHCFDYLPIECANSMEWKKPLVERRVILLKKDEEAKKKDLLKALGRTNVKIVPQFVINNEDELNDLYEKFLEQGFEGAMLKDPKGPYVPKRKDYWLKLKPMKTIDGEITEVVMGTSPRTKGILGKFMILLENGETTGCGSGFTLAQRAEYWKKRKSLIGKWIEMKVQDDPQKVAKARFPIFMKIREDLPNGK